MTARPTTPHASRRHLAVATLLVALVALFLPIATRVIAQSPTRPVVHHLRIDTDTLRGDMIDRHHHYILHRMLTRAESENASAFVVELNTNGGALDAALMINQRLMDAKIPTIAFVNTRAISAGALIAMSTDRIYMRPGATIGAAMPVTYGGKDGIQSLVDGKVTSAVAAQMKSAAAAKGHPDKLAVAMVDPGQPLEGYSRDGQPLTLTADEALTLELAEDMPNDLAGVLEAAGFTGAEVKGERLTPLEWVGAQASRPFITALLFAAAIICFIIEFKMPGIGVPAFAGLCFLALAQFGSLMADLSGILEPIMLMLGLTLIAVELFVLPGFGVAGIGGAALVLGALALSMNNLPLSFLGLARYWLGTTIYSILGSLVAIIIGLPITLKVLPYVPYLNSLMMAEVGPDGPKADIKPVERTTIALKEGMLGHTETDLRPSGVATFGGERYDVVSEGRFIDKGVDVVLRRIEHGKVIVIPRPLNSI